MEALKRFLRDFRPIEYLLFFGSVLAIVLSFALTENTDYLQLAASLVGACSLILLSKGNVAGQFLSVLFSLAYGVISYVFTYYGEMITYLCMNVPVALYAIVCWLKHPFRGKRSEVAVNRLKAREYPLILAAGAAVSIAFYFILRALGTANLVWSTLSVFTSFLSMLLSARRSPLYALAYILNDVVLILLWSLAAAEESRYLAMVVCFSVFLVNDIYGFVNWLRMRKRQEHS